MMQNKMISLEGISEGKSASPTLFQQDTISLTFLHHAQAINRLNAEGRTEDLSYGIKPWDPQLWKGGTARWTHAFFNTCLFMGVVGFQNGEIAWAKRGHISPRNMSHEMVGSMFQAPSGETTDTPLVIRMAGLSGYENRTLFEASVFEIMAALDELRLGYTLEWKEPRSANIPVIHDRNGKAISDLGGYHDGSVITNRIGRAGFFGISNHPADAKNPWVLASVSTTGSMMEPVTTKIFSQAGMSQFPQG